MSALYYRTVSLGAVLALAGSLGAGFILGAFLPRMVSARSERVVSYEEAVAGPVQGDAGGGSGPVEGDAGGSGPDAEIPLSAEIYDGPGFARSMPIDRKEDWIAWMREGGRGDSPAFMEERWALAGAFVQSGELKRPEDVRAFLLSPREHFVRARNRGYEYADTWLSIGYGATITDPDVVAMMTTTLEIKPGEKVLEIGTGSGYQSAILSYLTTNVYTIEIIEPLFIETDRLYRDLEAAFPSYSVIKRKLGDGYYGWEEYAPFDKILVTCSIDHIPPPLLKQLKTGGVMVLPLGPPGRQYIMEVKKEASEDGGVTLSRRDVYNGMSVRFIPFRNEAGGSYSASP
ncbi:MAG: protein-L-isoaspartate O-methyltransferase [Treponema sp.]|jgi:protein-L-isoaspartate(D-aspartate) O-methyltransferase|nr:protein-L-isoaspartate O-methyltransferase [Treponema sp.]